MRRTRTRVDIEGAGLTRASYSAVEQAARQARKAMKKAETSVIAGRYTGFDDDVIGAYIADCALEAVAEAERLSRYIAAYLIANGRAEDAARLGYSEPTEED